MLHRVVDESHEQIHHRRKIRMISRSALRCWLVSIHKINRRPNDGWRRWWPA